MCVTKGRPMPTTQKNRIQEIVTSYLKALGPDWYEELAETFSWRYCEKDVNTTHHAYKMATKFGLEYVGHGCTRVVFRVCNLIVKIEKRSAHDNEALQFGNRNEISTFNMIEENYPKILPFILKPLAVFTYDSVPFLIFPEIDHDNELGNIIYNNDHEESLDATKVYRWLDRVLDDQCMGANTFAFGGFPVSIDFGVCPECGSAARMRYFCYTNGVETIDTIMESEEFASFARDMSALYDLADEELNKAA
jgi:hypothetical protein